MKRLIASAGAAALLAGSGLVGAPPATAAKKYTACVKKSTGEMRILLGKNKKCAPGWKKRKWTKAGPTGDPGAGGAKGATGTPNSLGTLVDGTGSPVGRLMAAFPSESGMWFTVEIDGGLYTYEGAGRVRPFAPLYFANAMCMGQAYLTAHSAEYATEIMGWYGVRVVYRQTEPTWGPPSAYKFAGTSQSVAAVPLWERTQDGGCAANGPFTGFLLPLTEITSPTDRPGPLRVQ